MVARSETVFFRLRSFIKAIDRFDKHVSGSITAHIIHFEMTWCDSRDDGELPSGYCIEEGRKDFAREYLKSAFLSSAVNTLCSMRQHAGLTQSQVAERLNTKQSAIARLEGDFDGGISLRRYVDFALACGMVPHNITFAPLESAINYTIDQSKIAYTQVNDQEWLKANSPLISVSVESVAKVESNSEMISKRFQAQKDAVLSIERHTR